VRGIRQILNHGGEDVSLTWPKVQSPCYLLPNSPFARGYALLQTHHLSFDLMVNPHQLKDAAAFVHNFREIPVILDHIGCLKVDKGSDSENEKALQAWREGLRAVANEPHTNVKLSQLCFTKRGWETNSEANSYMRERVLEVITTFGPERCMFGSNFPVDKCMGSDMNVIYDNFLQFVKDFTHEQKVDMFCNTAKRVYRM